MTKEIINTLREYLNLPVAITDQQIIEVTNGTLLLMIVILNKRMEELKNSIEELFQR